ncbi:MAG: hypothetical protein ACFFCF_05895 [Promethearchaeota archaeon]
MWEKLHEDQILHLFNTTYDIVQMPDVRSRDFETAMVLHPEKGYIGYLIKKNSRFFFLDELRIQDVFQEWFASLRETP